MIISFVLLYIVVLGQIFEFGLPEGQSLNLPAVACVLMNAPGQGKDGSDSVRPYTPISDNSMKSKFQLLIKDYPDGCVSNWITNLPLGTPVNLRQALSRIFNI